MIMSLATMCGAYINDNETFGQDDDTSLQTIIRQKSFALYNKMNNKHVEMKSKHSRSFCKCFWDIGIVKFK